MSESLGKKAEDKISEWLDRECDGYSFDRIPDQLSGFYGSSNICDFECYKYPYKFYIESKATEKDRFDFSMLTTIQYNGLLRKSKITGCYGYVIVLFAYYQRAFIVPIQEIDRLVKQGKHSLNINKVEKWDIQFSEIQTIPSRKKLLDYTGELPVIETA